MSDFMLEPQEIEPERPERRRPVRLVGTGLAPTAEVPTARRKGEPRPCYAPCPACGSAVVTGETANGVTVVLDLAVQTYTIVWPADATQPLAQPSRAYPLHACGSEPK